MSIKKSLKNLSMALGGPAEARTISGLIDEISLAKNPLLGMTIDFDIADTTDLLGKYDYELQENMVVNGDVVTGTLLYVDDYTGFSGDAKEQVGNFIAIHCDVPGVTGEEITFISRKGTEYPVDQSDGLIVLRITAPTKLKFKVEKDGYPTITKEYSIKDLKLEQTVRPTPNA